MSSFANAWYNSGIYPYRLLLNCSGMSYGTPLMVNGSSGFKTNGVTQYVWTYCSGSTTAVYLHNTTDITGYIVANDTTQLPMEVELGNASSYNPTLVWSPSNAVAVYHMGQTTTLVDSVGLNNLTNQATCSLSSITTSLAYAIKLDGTCWFKKTSPVGLPTGNNARSEQFFAITASASAVHEPVLAYGTDGANQYSALAIRFSNSNVFAAYHGGTDFATAIATPISRDYQYARTLDGSTETIYWNASTNQGQSYSSQNTGTTVIDIGVHIDGGSLKVTATNVTEIRIFNSTKSQTFLNETWQNSLSVVGYGGVGSLESFLSPATINMSAALPGADSALNVLPIQFNVTVNFTYSSNCSLLINSSVNQTLTGLSGLSQFVEFNVSDIGEGAYDYFINCFDNTSSVNSSSTHFHYDATQPPITTNYTNASLFYWGQVGNWSSMWNVTDNLYIYSFNLSIDGSQVVGATGIGTIFYQYNLSRNISSYSLGYHNLTVRAADGHTAKKLNSKDDYNPSGGQWLEYDIKGKYKPVNIKVYEKGSKSGDYWSVFPKLDRFSEVYIPEVKKSSYVFVVESDNDIFIAKKLGHYGGAWLIIGDHWKDFVLENEPLASLDIKCSGKKKCEVTIDNVLHPEKLVFSSTGELNVNTKSYSFYVFNVSESYSSYIPAGFTTNFYLNVAFGNLSGLTLGDYNPVAVLVWNDTNYSATRNTYTTNNANFSYALSVPLIPNFSITVWHNWWFNMTPAIGWINTTNQTQNLTNVSIGTCIAGRNYSVVNFTYLNEVNDSSVNISSNNYQLVFYDGTYYYNVSGTITDETVTHLCTNVNPSNLSYNWNMWGTLTIQATGFITKVFTIDAGSPTAVSNNPSVNVNLFVISVGDSTTVDFTWLTSEFQQVDGTMKIYRCNNDSTRSLVDSQPIINSKAYGNLQLLVTPYSYEVLIDGVIYTDVWTTCHVESVASREFIVNMQTVNILPVIGLFLVDCTLTNVSNVVTMTWSANPEDTTSISACIVGRRATIYNMTEVYRNCSNATSGSHSVTIPSLPNSYEVSGEITQNGYKGYCRNTITVSHSATEAKVMGATGILGIVLLVMSLALMYSADGEKSVIASVAGVLIAYVLGIIAFPWPVVSAIIGVCLIIVGIGRYTKNGSIF